MPTTYKRGECVILPKGYRVGAGKLRKDEPATIDTVEKDCDGGPMYRIRFYGKHGEVRTTYYNPTVDGTLEYR